MAIIKKTNKQIPWIFRLENKNVFSNISQMDLFKTATRQNNSKKLQSHNAWSQCPIWVSNPREFSKSSLNIKHGRMFWQHLIQNVKVLSCPVLRVDWKLCACFIHRPALYTKSALKRAFHDRVLKHVRIHMSSTFIPQFFDALGLFQVFEKFNGLNTIFDF